MSKMLKGPVLYTHTLDQQFSVRELFSFTLKVNFISFLRPTLSITRNPKIEYIGRTLDEGSSISQKFADLLLTTESLVLTANDLLYKCGLKSNMIVKASESKLVKPILQNRGWKRVWSKEYLGSGRGYILVRD